MIRWHCVESDSGLQTGPRISGSLMSLARKKLDPKPKFGGAETLFSDLKTNQV